MYFDWKLVNGFNFLNHEEDFVFTVKSVNFHRIKRISIELPDSVFSIRSNSDCIETIESEIKVDRCWVEDYGSKVIIWVFIS